MILHKININDFTNSFGISNFHQELLDSSFGSKVINVATDLKYVKINLTEGLTVDEISELTTIITNHEQYVPSDIEAKGYNLLVEKDYHKSRNELKDIATTLGFANMNDVEKELAAKYCLVDDMTIIGYYMGQGLDLTTAQAKHLVRRAEDISRAAKSCEYRARTSVVKYISIKYMEEADAAMFMDATRNLITDYSLIAHLGIGYGQSREGIMNFVEATEAYINGGLSTYNFREGLTYEQCRDELKEYLVYGNEPTEFNVFSS